MMMKMKKSKRKIKTALVNTPVKSPVVDKDVVYLTSQSTYYGQQKPVKVARPQGIKPLEI